MSGICSCTSIRCNGHTTCTWCSTIVHSIRFAVSAGTHESTRNSISDLFSQFSWFHLRKMFISSIDSCRQWSSKMLVADWKKILIDWVASAHSAHWKGNRLVEYVPINCVSIRQKRWPDVRQRKSMKQEAHTHSHIYLLRTVASAHWKWCRASENHMHCCARNQSIEANRADLRQVPIVNNNDNNGGFDFAIRS